MTDLAATLLTPPGEGGISVIALAGEGAAALALARLSSRKPPRAPEPGRLHYGRFMNAAGEALDEVIVACIASDYVEINCHGGAVPARRVLRSLEEAGAQREGVAPRTRRLGRIEREAFDALAQAVTDLSARVFAAQYGGALRARIGGITSLLASSPRFEEASRDLDALLATAPLGLALARAPRVAIRGPVNAGKSTLANALAGFSRSIVSDVAGTTRDALSVDVSLSGIPVVLYDTAGEGLVRGALDEAAQARARRAHEAAAAAVVVIDASAPLPEGYRPRILPGRTVVAANKSDLPASARTLDAARAWGAPVVATSALAGGGVDALSRAILAALGLATPACDCALRGVVFAEWQREALVEAARALSKGDAAGARAALEWLVARA